LRPIVSRLTLVNTHLFCDYVMGKRQAPESQYVGWLA
jgi:hypothetical protein